MEHEPNQVLEWKDYMNDYRVKHKKLQFEQQPCKKVTYKEVKEKEQLFNPVLQIFNNEESETTEIKKAKDRIQISLQRNQKPLEKYQKAYDIINLEKRENVKAQELAKNRNVLMPSIQEYNIITNQPYDENFFKNIKVLKQPKPKEKKIDMSSYRQFNIINNQYWKDNESLAKQDIEKYNKSLYDNYSKFIQKNEYNLIKGQFFDQQKEEEFQKTLLEKSKVHGLDSLNKLPPTYKYRESVLFDPSKPIPEEIKNIDKKKENNLQKYKLKYKIEQEVKGRDFSTQDEKLKRLQERFNEEKYMQQFEKGYDIINLDKTNPENLRKYIKKKPMQDTWSKIVTTSQNHINELGPHLPPGTMTQTLGSTVQQTGNLQESKAESLFQSTGQLQQNQEQPQPGESQEQPDQDKVVEGQSVKDNGNEQQAQQSQNEVSSNQQLEKTSKIPVAGSEQSIYSSNAENDLLKKSANYFGPRSRVLLPKLNASKQEKPDALAQTQNFAAFSQDLPESERLFSHTTQQLTVKPQNPVFENYISVKKDYLNDPTNVVLGLDQPRIKPQFVEPPKRIKTSGFSSKVQENAD